MDASTILIWVIMAVVMIASTFVQKRLTSRIAQYSRVGAPLTGAQIAERMLAENGIRDVKIVSIEGTLTDHYNPTNKTVNLSHDVYYGQNIAACAVAAHECGHVLQHASGYFPLRIRTMLVPVVNFSNKVVPWVLLAGVLLVQVVPQLLWLGIGLFAMTTLFSIVTLPVEINASSRAVKYLEMTGVATYQTKEMAADALKWAAYTYVIAALSSLATLLYYVSMARRN
ncbi:MAG: zinc metallopeptidase [Bacteroidales bacterium]|nr:zinc metallopeptidase [Bacteroidales bacterium]